tara:strand:+ start:3830 stop:4801 length:972 start_codon:yes stop_codon:yes gene_type:complete
MNKKHKTENALPYFSIVIPVYNEEEHIGSCLQSIFNSDYDNTQYEVIVVDNGSEDRSHQIAVSSGRARVFQLPEGNVGAVRNYGADQAHGEILIFIDADCLLDNEWLNRAEKLIEEHPNCAHGGGAKLPNNATWIETSWLLVNKGRPILPKHLIGASTMIPKDLFLHIGGFNERVSSGEDTDLHNRIESNNMSVIIDHALDVTHLGNAKTPLQFVRRQIWHSENYLINLGNSLKDPVFFITLTFLFSSSLLIIQSIFLSGNKQFLINLALCSLIPALLSYKRMYRARYFTLTPHVLLQIYFLDLLYLTGRSIGLLKGALKKSN